MAEDVRSEPCAKWIRAYRDGQLVADTRHAVYVWEVPTFPAYYLPRTDVRLEALAAGEFRDAGSGLVRLAFTRFDWFEEDERIIVPPRDPYTRVDILASSRHVEVAVNGVAIADSRRPTMLFETNL